MGFIVQRVNETRKPDGHYLTKNGIDWLITEITISASGYVTLKIHDPIRLENQVVKAGTIEELSNKADGFTYKECL